MARLYYISFEQVAKRSYYTTDSFLWIANAFLMETEEESEVWSEKNYFNFPKRRT